MGCSTFHSPLGLAEHEPSSLDMLSGLIIVEEWARIPCLVTGDQEQQLLSRIDPWWEMRRSWMDLLQLSATLFDSVARWLCFRPPTQSGTARSQDEHLYLVHAQ